MESVAGESVNSHPKETKILILTENFDQLRKSCKCVGAPDEQVMG